MSYRRKVFVAIVTRALTLYSAEVEDQTTVTGKLSEHIMQGLNKGMIAYVAGCLWGFFTSFGSSVIQLRSYTMPDLDNEHGLMSFCFKLH